MLEPIESIHQLADADAMRTIRGTSGDDQLAGGAKAETLLGFGGDDLISGGGGADTIQGGAGADTIIGGTGADVLTGNGGADVFMFDDLGDSRLDDPDRITDLKRADIIDLSHIDADTTTAGAQAFHMVHGHFTGHAGKLLVTLVLPEQGDPWTEIAADVDGDGAADLVLHADGRNLAFNHFVL